ncbi:membrane bound O-acyl transferase (MBOAT) family protein [Actinidia rufa]|uniref:diacylglycerol O-acyltransferase n=1 Tax=Actinidia rufa TaxID=165716 RepID=A0A7J0EN02_9ERIC|nr:membrane bound O-acyl transferase (MBOAT) family protein [Actinidia rufa]
MGTTEEKILVSARLRPLNEKEIARNDVSDWECLNENSIVFKNNDLPVPERSMYPTANTFAKSVILYIRVITYGSSTKFRSYGVDKSKEPLVFDSAVLSGVTLMLFACIVWLKLVSYAHTSSDMRSLAKPLDKGEALSASSDIRYSYDVSFKSLLYLMVAPTLCYQRFFTFKYY